jgi:putative transposase
MPSTYTNLLYHVVFSTKQRIPLITADLQEELYKYIGGIIRAEGGVQLEIGGTNDHVHILTKFKPAISVSEMLAKIKANSSK